MCSRALLSSTISGLWMWRREFVHGCWVSCCCGYKPISRGNELCMSVISGLRSLCLLVDTMCLCVCVWVWWLIHTCTHIDLGTPSASATDWFGWGQWGVFGVEIIEWNVDLPSKVNIYAIYLNPVYPPGFFNTQHRSPLLSFFYSFELTFGWFLWLGKLHMCTHMHRMSVCAV